MPALLRDLAPDRPRFSAQTVDHNIVGRAGEPLVMDVGDVVARALQYPSLSHREVLVDLHSHSDPGTR